MMLADLHYGLRALIKAPQFTLVALLVLALGIGANTAMFSVVNAILLRPLPLADPARLMVVWETNLTQGRGRVGPSGANFVDFKEQNTSFEGLAALEPGSGTVTGFGEPQQVPGIRVSTNYLSLLGARPLAGRDFLPAEGWQNRVAIVSHGFWQRTLGADPHAIGRRVTIDALPYTIVGILPSTFWSPVPSELLVPWSTADLRAQPRLDHRFGVIGRLKRDVTTDRANAELTAIEQRIAGEVPQLRGWSTTVVPLQRAVGEQIGDSLVVLLAAVGFVLLIACANLANLLLARAVVRQRETAIRRALGATRGRLIRQCLTESLLLSAIGGASGLLLAAWSVAALDRVLPASFAVSGGGTVLRPPVTIDVAVVSFTTLTALATSLVFGLIPAIVSTRGDAQDWLRDQARSTTGAHGRVRQLLIVAEVALALVLLVASGLTIKSFWRLLQVDPGFAPDRVLALEIELPTDGKYRDPVEQAAFFTRVIDRARELPGVRHAAVSEVLPLDSTVSRTEEFQIPSRPLIAGGARLPADRRSVSADYFSTMGIPLRRGRLFAEGDRRGRPWVVIVDETLARLYFSGGLDPIGQQLRIGATDLQIVGVVGAVKDAGLDKDPKPTIYLSHLQAPAARMDLVAQTAVDPASMVNALKSAVYAVDTDQPVYKIRTMRQAVSEVEASPRATLVLLAVFAAAAFLLAAIGIYGVVAYTVVQRTREIGIRLALGADSGRIVRTIVGHGLATAMTGAGVGLVLALAATRVLASLLFGVSPRDPFVLLTTMIVLTMVAIVASYVPARRAAAIDPAVSLRHDY